jgi:hypothetical protein
VNTKIRPGVAIIIVLAALGVIFGIMWFQSEAPRINKLPRGMAVGPPGPLPKKADPAQSSSAKQDKSKTSENAAGSSEKAGKP